MLPPISDVTHITLAHCHAVGRGYPPHQFSVDNQQFTTSGTAAETVLDFYKQAISVARVIAFAVEQPDDVDVNAIVIRPTAQQF